MALARYRLVLVMSVALLSLVTGVYAAENPAETSLTLVKDGQPAASIVIARDATRVAQFAAYELQWHLVQITGAQVPIIRDDEPIAGTRLLVGEIALTTSHCFKSGPHFVDIEFQPTGESNRGVE